MAQWLYRIEPIRPEMVDAPTAAESAAVDAHFSRLVTLRDEGVLILAGRTQEAPGTFGIVIFEAPDEASARAIAESDPAVVAGVFAMTLHPYAVALARGGLV